MRPEWRNVQIEVLQFPRGANTDLAGLSKACLRSIDWRWTLCPLSYIRHWTWVRVKGLPTEECDGLKTLMMSATLCFNLDEAYGWLAIFCSIHLSDKPYMLAGANISLPGVGPMPHFCHHVVRWLERC